MTQKKLSRRDAIKLLGAATGATLLANLPSKWKTPELASGVLPAHAQTSILYSLICDPDGQGVPQDGGPDPFVVAISPNIPNGATVTLRWNASGTDGETFLQGSTGTVDITGPANVAILDLMVINSNTGGGLVTVVWSFENPANGNGTCSQSNPWSSF